MSKKAQLSTAAFALASALLLSACGNSVEEQATVATSPSATTSSSASQASSSATPSKSSAAPSPSQTPATPAETSPAPSPALEEAEAVETNQAAPSPEAAPVQENKAEELAPTDATTAAPEKSSSSAPVPVGTVITVPAKEEPKTEVTTSPSSSPQASNPAPTPVTSTAPSQANTTGTQICNYGNLQVAAAAAEGSGAAGSRYITLSFTNTGDLPCSISGYPGVNYVDSNGNQIGLAASQAAEWTSSGRILASGETITATLRETRAGLYETQTCQPQTAAGYRVTLPGTSNSLIITFPAEACSGSVNQLSVGQVGAGS